MSKHSSYIILAVLLLAGCAAETETETADAAPDLLLGAERLFTDYYHLVEEQRVGVVTNHSAVVGEDHIVDLIHADEGIELTALFGPEHGVRGTADAGEAVEHDVDEETGVPIYSLYGEHRKPTLEMLENVDLLIFDIQDVGARNYTYLATMGLAMESAAEAGIPYLILDRPNPLGGRRIEGHIREDEFTSFIGRYPTPITHGMTAGEMALMIHGERWHNDIEDLSLFIVEMEGWNRDMLWHDTGLNWIAPSPNLPDMETTIVYPGTAFFQGTGASEGRGTYEPFLQVGSPYVDAQLVAEELNRRNLPGLNFHATEFVPESIDGMSREPKLEGETVRGVRLEVTDPYAVEPVAAGVHLLQVFYEHLPEEHREEFFNDRNMKLRTGNREVLRRLKEGRNIDQIIDWQEEIAFFQNQRTPYLIYD